MGWRASSVMDEKLRFVFSYERDEESMKALCERFGISRETGYVWLRRYRQSGSEARALFPDNLARARGYFERALTLDPGHTDALVGIADVDTASGVALMSADRVARLAAAEAAAAKALSSAPDHALANRAMGYVQIFSNRAARGIGDCERALALDRNLADAHAYIGYAKIALGRCEETEAHIQEALRLSPRDPTAYAWMLFAGMAKFFLTKDQEAVAWLRRSIEFNRNYPIARFYLAAALTRLGRLDEAQAAVVAGLALDPTFTIRRFRAAHQATILSISRDAKAPSKSCARPECRSNEFFGDAASSHVTGKSLVWVIHITSSASRALPLIPGDLN